MFKFMVGLLISLCVFSTQVNASVSTGLSYSDKIFIKRYVSYIDLISEASDKTDVPMDELAAFIKIESGFVPTALNEEFNAGGLLQHLPYIWEYHKKRFGKEMGIPADASVYDPKASLFIGAAALAEQRTDLAKATNLTPDQIQSGDLYLVHAYGFQRAAKIINAPEGTKINKFVKINYKSGLTFHINKRLMTTAEFRQGVIRKLDGEKVRFRNVTRDYQLTQFIAKLERKTNRFFAYNQ